MLQLCYPVQLLRVRGALSEYMTLTLRLISGDIVELHHLRERVGVGEN